MEPGQIIYSGTTKKGIDIVIRYPTAEDLDRMLEFINAASKEKTFIYLQGHQLSLEEEKEYLDSLLKRIAEHKEVYLGVFHANKLIASSSIEMRPHAESHVGGFGIIVSKDFRGQGIGKLLMQVVLDEAIKNIPDLRICVLSVFDDNDIAKNMYSKSGFVEMGKIPKGIKHGDEYVDHVYMYKNLYENSN